MFYYGLLEDIYNLYNDFVEMYLSYYNSAIGFNIDSRQ